MRAVWLFAILTALVMLVQLATAGLVMRENRNSSGRQEHNSSDRREGHGHHDHHEGRDGNETQEGHEIHEGHEGRESRDGEGDERREGDDHEGDERREGHDREGDERREGRDGEGDERREGRDHEGDERREGRDREGQEGDERRDRRRQRTEGGRRRKGRPDRPGRPNREQDENGSQDSPRRDRPNRRQRPDPSRRDQPTQDGHVPHGTQGHEHHESHESHELHEHPEIPHGQPGHQHHESHESHELHEHPEIPHGQPGHQHNESHESHEMHEGHDHHHGHDHGDHGSRRHGDHGDGPAWMEDAHHSSHTPQFHRFLRMIVGQWNNQQQVEQEGRERKAARERHPPFQSTVTRVTLRDGMFPDGHITLLVQDAMETPEGQVIMLHLMQLRPHENGVHMIVHKFRDQNAILENSEDPATFLSLSEEDLINLGEACEQHWTPREVGGTPQFYVEGTMGVCMARMPNGLQMRLDLASVVTPEWLSLQYNGFLENGTTVMYWPTPFILTRTYNFQQVLTELMAGDELHYCVDLRQCESESPQEEVPANLNIDMIGGPLNEFQYVEPGSLEQSYIRYTFSELVIPPNDQGERSSRITEMYYYGNESVVVKLISRPLNFSIAPSSRTLRCQAPSSGHGGSGVFLNHPNPRKRLLAGFEAVSDALHHGKELRLVVDMMRCDVGGDHAMSIVKAGGTRLYVHTMVESDGRQTITFNTMSLSSNVCGPGIMAGGVHATLTSDSDVIGLNQWGMVFMQWAECFSTQMSCPVDQQAVRIYQV